MDIRSNSKNIINGTVCDTNSSELIVTASNNLGVMVESEDSSSSIAAIIADSSSVEPIDEALFINIFEEKYKLLTDKQKVVIDGLLANKTQVEISREEGVDTTAIRDRLRCARDILK